MSEIKIITNHHRRELMHQWDVPQQVIESDFDYTTDESLFFRYKGQWYCLDDFPAYGTVWMPTPSEDSPLHGWDAFASDSFFSGIAIKFPQDDWGPDYDSIIVALVLA